MTEPDQEKPRPDVRLYSEHQRHMQEQRTADDCHWCNEYREPGSREY